MGILNSRKRAIKYKENSTIKLEWKSILKIITWFMEMGDFTKYFMHFIDEWLARYRSSLSAMGDKCQLDKGKLCVIGIPDD